MYIHSKLKNIDFSLFHLNLKDTTDFKSQTINCQPKDWLEINCSLQYTQEFCIINTHFSNTQDLLDVFTIEGEYFQISLVGKGKSSLENSINEEHIHPGNIQFTFQNSSSWEILMPAHTSTHYTCIILSKNFYLNLLKDEKWIAQDTLYKKVIAQDHLKIGEFKFPITFSMQQIIHQISECTFPNDFKKDYLKLKLKELFYVYFLQQQLQSPAAGISEDTIKKVKNAKAYLATNFYKTPTIKEISRKVLLNEQALKTSFKEIYGTTIRGYAIQLKMKKALYLLKDHTVNEISNILGYKSTSHFIMMFKKYYGYTPKQVLKE